MARILKGWDTKPKAYKNPAKFLPGETVYHLDKRDALPWAMGLFTITISGPPIELNGKYYYAGVLVNKTGKLYHLEEIAETVLHKLPQ